MSKIAKDAFAKSNYHLAVEIFERCLRDKNLPITLDLYFWYGDSLARTGRLSEAFDVYTYICNKLNDQIPIDRLKHLSSSLLDSLISNNQQHEQKQQQRPQLAKNNNIETVTSQINFNKNYNISSNFNQNDYEQCHLWKRIKTATTTTTTTTATTTTNKQLTPSTIIATMPCNTNNYDSLLCPICNDILNCPVTATCGHTFCRECYNQNELNNNNNNKCYMCLIESNNNNYKNNINYSKNSNSCFNHNHNNNRSSNFEINLKPDILVRRLVDKWWGPQLQARDLNQQATKYIHLNKFDEALKCCNESLEKCPKNINSLLLRSEVLYKLSHYQSSLADADNALRCHPTSAKAFYRRALALMGLTKNDEAFVAQCIAASLDRNISCTSSFKTEMSRLLQRIITSANKTSSCGAAHTSAPYSSPSLRRRQQQRRKLKKMAQHQQQFGTSDCEEANSSCGEDDLHNNNVQFNRRYSRRHSTIRVEVPIVSQTSTTLRILLARIQQELHKLNRIENYSNSYLNVNPALIDFADFDCVLCCRTLWKPVVTPCGHTYCWVCLDRCMDYSSSCPLCMTPLVEQYLSNYHQQLCAGGNTPMPFSLGEKSVTRFLEVAMQIFIPERYEKRRRQEIDIEPSVPVFICTTAFPNVPCPLFVYEPRYRLMVRRAIESGERQFGIVQPFTGKSRYSDIGTMLDIRDSVLLGDGCSILSTIGCKRFKILTRNEKDGYETAKVEFINDEPISENTISEVHYMHSSVLLKARKWFESLSIEIKEEIVRSFGSMPALEENWEKVGDGPAWAWWIIAILPLNQQLKINILATTSLEKRLRAIGKTLDCINGTARQSQQNCIAVPCDGLPACQALECCQRASTGTTTADEHHVTTNQHTSFLL